MKIDLNCDIGESFGIYSLGRDEDIMPYISSANIACGAHAGDPEVMKRTVGLAIKHGVSIGAHPGYPDLAGFGRREMSLTPEEIYSLVVYQIGALAAFAKVEGGALHHVKPHGALYNQAAMSKEISRAIATAVADVDPSLVLYGLAGSELIAAGKAVGLTTANEVFADRTYAPNGTLTPRRLPNALLTDAEAAADQVIRIVKHNAVQTTDGTDIQLEADTICIHGDSEQAVAFARFIHRRLQAVGINIATV